MMSHRLISLLSIGCTIATLLLACKPDEDLGFSPSGEPRILAVSVAGIANPNIVIDQATRQIQITLPANFTASQVKPQFTLTPNTETWSRYNVDAIWLYPLQQRYADSVRVRRTDTGQQNAYRVIFKAGGELAFATLSAPVVRTVTEGRTYICLPVYNYADGEPEATFTLTHRQTGRQYSQTGRFAYESPCNQGKPSENVIASIWIDTYDYYQPGEYTAELVKANGRRATLNQPVVLERGPVSIFSATEYSAIAGEKWAVFGTNIFRNERYGVVLRSPGQPPVTVQADAFRTNQAGFDITIPATLPSGYYYAQLLVNGTPTNAFVRIVVAKEPTELVVYQMWGYSLQDTELVRLNPAQSFDKPLVMRREIEYSIVTNDHFVRVKAGNINLKRQINLTSVVDPAQQYRIPFPNEGPASIKVPATLPVGRYRLTAEVVLPDGSLVSSKPLERSVDIQ
jgi:hypothetical protein